MPFKFDANRYFDNGVSEDFLKMSIGDYLGSGLDREVYEFAFDKDYVIKIETNDKSFSNIMEWEIWQQVKQLTKLSLWFAPCHMISPRGQFLIQKKTQQLTPKVRLPKKIPAIIGDTHMWNWGTIDGRLVCHDYANHNAIDIANNVNLVTAKWITE